MAQLVYGLYESDDTVIETALLMHPDTFAVQSFVPPTLSTPRRPQKLSPRREVFWNSVGHKIELPAPTVYWPHPMGTFATIRGDPTYVKTAQVGELNRAEAV